METNECYVYFALDGEEFDPDDVTSLLGITPTFVKRKGERIPGKVPRCNSWALSTETVVDEVIDVGAMAASIIKELRPKAALINKAKKIFGAISRLEVVVTITTDDKQSTPAIGFEAEDVAFLAEVGAYIDVDTYRK